MNRRAGLIAAGTRPTAFACTNCRIEVSEVGEQVGRGVVGRIRDEEGHATTIVVPRTRYTDYSGFIDRVVW